MYIRDIRSFSAENVSPNVYDLNIIDVQAGEQEFAALLAHFTECIHLKISMPRLRSVPDVLKRIDKLRYVHIASELVDEIPDDLVPATVTSFHFEGKTLTRLPHFLWSNTIESIYMKVFQLQQQESVLPIGYVSKVNDLHLCIGNLKKLPDFLSLMTSVKNLVIESDMLEEIQPQSFDHHDLRYLSMSSRQLKKVPDLDKQVDLRHLRLESDMSLDLRGWKLPSSLQDLHLKGRDMKLPSLGQVPALSRLWLDGVTDHIGEDIGQCQDLRSLICQNSKIESISNAIARCNHLGNVQISASLTAFPETLLQVRALEVLRIEDNTILSFNYDWSSLVNLKDLSLRRNKAQIDQLAFISDLPKLSSIYLEGNKVSSRYVWITKKKVPLHYPEGFFPDCKPDFKEVLAFGAALAKLSCEDSLKHEFFDHFWRVGELFLFSTANTQRLTHALNISYTPLKKLLLTYLDDLIQSNHGVSSLNEQAVVYAEGKTIESVAKLKEALAVLGVQYSANLTANVTHIIIGKNPSNAEVFNKGKYLYIYENDVFDKVNELQPKFLVEQAEQGEVHMLSGVTELLLNGEVANVKIGLQMLEAGGVPNELLEVLLTVVKSNPDASVRAEAKKTLTLHAPAWWRPLIDDKQLFKNLHDEDVKEQDIFHKLKSIEESAGFDSAALLSMVLFRRYKKGLRFMLMSVAKASDEQKRKMYDMLMTGEDLDFATGLGFKNWKGHDPGSMTLYPQKIKFPFPVDALKWYHVTGINFHNCKLSAIPKEITSFHELKKLDLSCNFLSKVPAHLEKLTRLEELDLSSNNFSEFPMNLTKFKKLKMVDLRNCRIDYSIVPLKVPDDFNMLMPECEVLV